MRQGWRVLGALIVAFWALTLAGRVGEWNDDMELWASAVRHAPLRARPQVNYAVALAQHGLKVQAVAELQRLADRSGDVEAGIMARRDSLRMSLTEKDFDAWFRGDPTAALLFSLAR